MRQLGFVEYCIQLWCSFLVAVAPKMVINSKIIKGKKYAAFYNVSQEKAYEIITEEGRSYDHDWIAARVWQRDQIEYFLEKGLYSFIKYVATEKEFFAAYNNGLTRVKLEQLLRVYTPKKDIFKKILSEEKTETVSYLAENAVTLFDVLTVEELLSLKNPQVDFFEVGKILSDKAPKRWCRSFMQIVRNKILRGDKACVDKFSSLYKFFVLVALKNEIELASEVRFMESHFTELYGKLKEKIHSTLYGANCIATVLPDKVRNLRHNDQDKAEDAWFWYEQALWQCSSATVIDTVVSLLPDLKSELSVQRYEDLKQVVLMNYHKASAVQLKSLLKNSDFSEYYGRIQGTLAKSASACLLMDYLPFSGWTEENQKIALNKIIKENFFNVSKLSLFSSEMQLFIEEELQTQAEILAIKKDPLGMAEMSLTVGAEKYLLQMDDAFRKYKERHIEKFGVYPENFECLLQSIRMLSHYASKRGLTKEQYLTILASPLKAEGVWLKSCVRK